MITPVHLIAVLFGIFAIYMLWKVITEKRKKLMQITLATAYERLLLRNGLSANVYEMISKGIIALDRKNKKLLIVYASNKGLQQHCICLRSIGEAKVAEETDASGNIHKIKLQLQHSANNVIYEAPFFDAHCDSVAELPSMAKKALHWKHRVDLHRRSGAVPVEQEYVL